jgi:hypothetical protein
MIDISSFSINCPLPRISWNSWIATMSRFSGDQNVATEKRNWRGTPWPYYIVQSKTTTTTSLSLALSVYP